MSVNCYLLKREHVIIDDYTIGLKLTCITHTAKSENGNKRYSKHTVG